MFVLAKILSQKFLFLTLFLLAGTKLFSPPGDTEEDLKDKIAFLSEKIRHNGKNEDTSADEDQLRNLTEELKIIKQLPKDQRPVSRFDKDNEGEVEIVLTDFNKLVKNLIEDPAFLNKIKLNENNSNLSDETLKLLNIKVNDFLNNKNKNFKEAYKTTLLNHLTTEVCIKKTKNWNPNDPFARASQNAINIEHPVDKGSKPQFNLYGTVKFNTRNEAFKKSLNNSNTRYLHEKLKIETEKEVKENPQTIIQQHRELFTNFNKLVKDLIKDSTFMDEISLNRIGYLSSETSTVFERKINDFLSDKNSVIKEQYKKTLLSHLTTEACIKKTTNWVRNDPFAKASQRAIDDEYGTNKYNLFEHVPFSVRNKAFETSFNQNDNYLQAIANVKLQAINKGERTAEKRIAEKDGNPLRLSSSKESTNSEKQPKTAQDSDSQKSPRTSSANLKGYSNSFLSRFRK